MQISELLLFGLLFAAIIGFNLLMQALIRRNKQREQGGSAPPEPAVPDEATQEIPSYWGRTPARELVHEQQQQAITRPTPAAVPRPSSAYHRRRRAPLFRSRRDLRRAVVTMTVLGPCRAMQPYDQDSSEQR